MPRYPNIDEINRRKSIINNNLKNLKNNYDITSLRKIYKICMPELNIDTYNAFYQFLKFRAQDTKIELENIVNDNRKLISNMIMEYRSKDMTYKEISEKLHVSQATIYMFCKTNNLINKTKEAEWYNYLESKQDGTVNQTEFRKENNMRYDTLSRFLRKYPELKAKFINYGIVNKFEFSIFSDPNKLKAILEDMEYTNDPDYIAKTYFKHKKQYESFINKLHNSGNFQ